MVDEILNLMLRRSTGTGFLIFLVIVFLQYGLNKFLKIKQTLFVTLNNIMFHFLNVTVLAYFMKFAKFPLPPQMYNFTDFFITYKFLSVLMILVLKDFVFYIVHRLCHSHAFLWVFHEAHHNTNELNFSAATRVPFYNILSFNIGTWPVAAPLIMLGLPLEFVYLSTSIHLYYGTWNHSGYMIKNKFVSKLLITPHDHAIHHENNIKSQRSNYGNMFSVFDKLFNTYNNGVCTQNYGSEINYDASNFINAQINPLIITIKTILKIKTFREFFGFIVLGKPLGKPDSNKNRVAVFTTP